MSELLDELRAVLGDDDPGTAAAGGEAARILEAARGEGEGAAEMRTRALALAQRRATGVPLAHVIGIHTFMGLTLESRAGVLVPREETELLARVALELLGERIESGDAPPGAIDMCCGAGNLACALAHAVPQLQVWASDLTGECASLARRNARRLGLGTRVEVVQGDLFEPLRQRGLEGAIDLVVCNPPYISTGRLTKDRAHLLTHEPREAFDGGPYGLSIHQRVIREAPAFLRGRGWLVFEIGLGQERQMERLLARSGDYEEVGQSCDERGAARVIAARVRGR